MKVFMFVITGEPRSDNEECKDIGGADIHVWVVENSASTAEGKARTYINRHGWIPQSIEHAFEIQPELIPELGKSETRLYRTALQHGIAADFLAYPKVEGSPSDPVQLRRVHPSNSQKE